MESLLFPMALRRGATWNCGSRCYILGHDALINSPQFFVGTVPIRSKGEDF